MSKTNNKNYTGSLIAAIIVSVIAIIADRFSKIAVTEYFVTGNEKVSVIPGVISFCYRLNNGAGFSILEGKTVFLIAFTAVAMALIIYLLVCGKYRSTLTNWGFCLVISGGVGNLIDRVFYGGQVVDFISTDFMDFPVFNVADICVTVGAALVILYFVIDTINEKNDKGKHLDSFNGTGNTENGENAEAEENSDTAKGEK